MKGVREGGMERKRGGGGGREREERADRDRARARERESCPLSFAGPSCEYCRYLWWGEVRVKRGGVERRGGVRECVREGGERPPWHAPGPPGALHYQPGFDAQVNPSQKLSTSEFSVARCV